MDHQLATGPGKDLEQRTGLIGRHGMPPRQHTDRLVDAREVPRRRGEGRYLVVVPAEDSNGNGCVMGLPQSQAPIPPARLEVMIGAEPGRALSGLEGEPRSARLHGDAVAARRPQWIHRTPSIAPGVFGMSTDHTNGRRGMPSNQDTGSTEGEDRLAGN